MTAGEDLDRWLPPRGPCLVCGVPGLDARHRVIDAITDAAGAGETADSIADEFGLSAQAVQAALRWSAENLAMTAGPQPAGLPRPGDIVMYKLDESDVPKISAWRANFRAHNASYAGHKHPHRPGEPGATGHIAHTGKDVCPGDEFPAMVIEAPDPPRLDLKVFLNGSDTLSATSVAEGEGPGRWRHR